MHKLAIELHKAAREAHARIYEMILSLRNDVVKCASKEELADYAYALRFAWRHIDDTRKDLKGLQELAEKLTCMKCTLLDDGDTIKTAYVTATPDCKPIASLPKKSKDPEGYRALMLGLGIPEYVLDEEDEERETFKPHFPGIVARLEKLMAEGKPLPPGIDVTKTYPKYSLELRPKKGVEE